MRKYIFGLSFALMWLGMWCEGFSMRGSRVSAMRPRGMSVNMAGDGVVPENVGVVLLAGGKGTRMKASMPKQFLPLLGRPVFLRSLDIFTAFPARTVSNIVIVLDESFRSEYRRIVEDDDRISWADPGDERQDSVFNGLQGIPDDCSVVAIHDAARPLVTEEEVLSVLADGYKHGAAVLGVPMKATVKESENGRFVLRTIPRSRLWEVHTPQVARKELLMAGFKKVAEEGLEVTDDVSVVEALGEPVRLTKGEYTNIKLTTPDDMNVAEHVLRERGVDEKKKIVKPNPVDRSYPCLAERCVDKLQGGDII